MPWVLLAIAATLLAALKVKPWIAGQVGYDTAASVLYFDRIVAGRHLESFVSATPKALLTVGDGLVYTITRDWRAISLLATLVFGVDVALAALLARRLGGPVAAGFAVIAFAGSVPLLEDASAAYAVGPAMLGWLVAAIALTSRRRHYLIAGVALMLAGLARFETLLLAGAIVAVLAALDLLGRRRPDLRPPRAAWILVLALAALPLQMIHDWLLTGEPLWAATVPAIVSATAAHASPLQIARLIVGHYATMGVLVLLAILGGTALALDRRLGVLLGLLVIGPGILALLIILAARGIYISNRYLYPPDLAITMAAAVGVAQLRVPRLQSDLMAGRRWLGRADRLPGRLGAAAAGCIVAFAAVSPWAPLDQQLTAKIQNNLAAFVNEHAALPALRAATASVPGISTLPADAGPRFRSPASAALLTPALLGPRMSVDLDIPMTSIGGVPYEIATDGSRPAAGQLVYHEPRLEPDAPSHSLLEVSTPTIVGQIRVVPLAADPVQRVWLLRIEAANGSATGAVR